jgi:hypothetical protein
MIRRKLLTGAAAIAAYGLLPKDARAQNQAITASPTVFPGDLLFKQQNSMLVQTLTNQTIMLGSLVDSTNNSMNVRKLHYAPTAASITDLVVCYPGFSYTGSSGTEALNPNAYAVTTYVEYPLGTTPLQLTVNGVSGSLPVPSGFGPPLQTDPYPNTIAPGDPYAIKHFVTWTGSFNIGSGIEAFVASSGEWTALGVGLTDQGGNLTAQVNTTSSRGWAGIPKGKLSPNCPVIGLIGDSWFAGAADVADPTTLSTTVMRAMRRKYPAINLGLGGYATNLYLSHPQGQLALTRDSITHLIMELVVNDISGGASLATLQANYQRIIAPYLARGIKVFGWTCSPHTTSIDHFMSATGQAVVSAANEIVRLAFNAWLRVNWLVMGLSGLVDAAHAIDPTDSGLWGFDAGQPAINYPTNPASASGYATVAGGVVTAVAQLGGLQNGATVGSGYPASTTGPWTSYPYPGESGSGAVGTWTSNSSGQIVTWTVTSGGAGYSAPPMINILGPWTGDGLHGYPRGWNEIISKTGLGPGMFAL